MTDTGHRPVMLDEVIGALAPSEGAIFVDGTFGGGGYSRAILEAANCDVWGIDRDPEACARGTVMAAEYDKRLKILNGRFSEMAILLKSEKTFAVDGIALDLGVSSFQISNAARGFSFREDGPLDMRMSQEGPSAADVINSIPEVVLADIIYRYGEERRSRRIARAIITARAKSPITRTSQLAQIIRQCFPLGATRKITSIDPATRTFQALRIYVNDELGELARGLRAAECLLRAGGRLVVVSFHSLEDRLVKSYLRERAGIQPRASRHLPHNSEVDNHSPDPSFILNSRRVAKPSKQEVAVNPRARSARLRAAMRTDAPTWPKQAAATGFGKSGITA